MTGTLRFDFYLGEKIKLAGILQNRVCAKYGEWRVDLEYEDINSVKSRERGDIKQ